MHHLKWRQWCPVSGMSSDSLLVRYPLGKFRPETSCSQLVFPRSVSKDSIMCHSTMETVTTLGSCAWQHRETLQCSWDGLYCSYTVLPAVLWIDRSDAGMMRRMHILMYCICSRAWLVLRRFTAALTAFFVLRLFLQPRSGLTLACCGTCVCMCTVFAATLDQLGDF